MSEERCHAMLGGTWDRFACGKPAVRDGLCGIHAAGADRRKRNREKRQADEAERQAVATTIRRLLGAPAGFGSVHHEHGSDHFSCDPYALIDLLTERAEQS